MAPTLAGGQHDGRQDPAEAASCLSPQGPAFVVALWLEAVFELQRWDVAARLSTPELRLAVAQAFLHRGQRCGAVSRAWGPSDADRLAEGETGHELWSLFDRSVRAGVAANEVARTGRFSVGSRPRPLDPLHELVLVVPSAAVVGAACELPGVGPVTEVAAPAAAALPRWGIAVRRQPLADHGWLVAGWRGARLPEPGWPPRL